MVSNKRGLEIVWSTVVVMVLGLMILLFLILFFTNSSGNFLQNIKSYFSYSNVDSVVQSCNLKYDSNAVTNFCCEKLDVKYYNESKKSQGMFSCSDLELKNITKGRIRLLDCSEVAC